ncbi:hypothetical protein J6590_061964 [Homalodisca vitripennis]|nr:hypothetical protein J6590_099863 [Homalodisca vitripennis]KAG8320723.1 hypothetical protein J6590_061964 [Homalodisca vitripennis]
MSSQDADSRAHELTSTLKVDVLIAKESEDIGSVTSWRIGVMWDTAFCLIGQLSFRTGPWRNRRGRKTELDPSDGSALPR